MSAGRRALLLLLHELRNVRADLGLLDLPRLRLAPVLVLDRRHHRVHLGLLLRKLLLGEPLCLHLLRNLRVQRSFDRPPLLLPQVVAVGLGLEAALALRLHQARDFRVGGALLLEQRGRLEDLRVALLVHVRLLQLLLELAQLLTLLDDALDILLLADRLRLALDELGGELLVLRAEPLRALLRLVRRLHLRRLVLLLDHLALLADDPLRDGAVIRLEVLPEHLIARDARHQLVALVVAHPLLLKLLLEADRRHGAAQRAQVETHNGELLAPGANHGDDQRM